jgi:lysophospholipase L1-like esterase
VSYSSVPHLVCRPATKVTALALGATAAITNQTRARRILFLADSQETSPNAAGRFWVSLFQHRLWTRWGNAPETPLTAPAAWGTNNTAPDSTGHSLVSCNNPDGLGTAQTTSYIPYGMEGTRPRVRSDAADVPPLWVVQHDNFTSPVSTTNIPRTNEYLLRTSMIGEVFLARLAGNNGTIQWRMRELANSAPAFFGTTLTASGTINTASATSVQGDVLSCVGAEGPVRSYLTPGFTWATAPSAGNLGTVYGEFNFASDSGATHTNILGFLARSANTRGFGVSGFAAGGIKTADIVANRGDSYNTINAYAPDIIAVMMGANDATNGKTKAQYKTDVEALISWIRTNVSPVPLIALFGDMDRSDATAGQRAELAQYAVANAEIAMDTDGVAAINRRRLAESLGWAVGTHAVGDGVHDDEAGSLIRATADEALLHSLLTEIGAGLSWTGTSHVSRINRARRVRLV